MGSKTISVDDEAYELLKHAKLADESFSDVVKRTLGGNRARLSELAGILTEGEAKKVKRAIREAREADAAAEERRERRLWG